MFRVLNMHIVIAALTDFTLSLPEHKKLLDVNKGKVDQYWAQMAILQRYTIIWSNSEETFLDGTKIPLIENLDKMVTNMTKTPLP
ncbi:uncharacterized protein BXZ73DRAFT_98789 [Epithele typhae]|uniref:uncharacterized protein n=1 Tax=Epithele typhae TaxID=378194 RepID=UPI002008168F|nr:uncharacterized protein BXZ73DRAFT_98789 [Epithele typhae]KAH9940349.1 hypothetical protein BXZ73DRAFT_98789 [Epithele typhae]